MKISKTKHITKKGVVKNNPVCYKKEENGSCIPYSEMKYRELLSQGKNPLMIEGWAVVDNADDLLPDEEFLKKHFPEQLDYINDDEDYDEYHRSFPHTWVESNGKRYDETGPLQAENYGYGKIVEYYVKRKYKL